MSSRRTSRALARLAVKNAVLRPLCGGTDFGVFASNDRRRRPVLKIAAADVRALQQDGVLRMREDGAFVLSEAGAARVKREEAAPEEAFLAQHRALTARSVIDADGAIRAVRGFDADGPMRRLAALRGASGEPWLTDAELSAAARLRADWLAGEIGQVRISDWSAAPIGSSARGPANAQEAAMARRCDAQRRAADALARLAAPLRRCVERIWLSEEGLEALERAEGWPARSGKLALKLGLAQLAAEF